MTHELREAIGAEEVVVPKDAPNRSHQRHATHSPFVAALLANAPILIITFLVALVVGGVVALVTEQYWALLVAAALHAAGTLAVAAGAIALATNVEHVAPAVAARLEEEGVPDPDRVLSELVEDFAGVRHAHGVPEVITTGHNERTVTPEQDQARSSVEQRTAMTPTSGGAPVGGSRSAIEALEWWIVGATSVLSVAVAAILGGEMWALPAIVLPLGAGWMPALTTRLAPYGERARVFGTDANAQIDEMLALLPGDAPAFAFLDPEGSELAWATVQAIAEHKPEPYRKVEQLILLPTDMGFVRTLPLAKDLTEDAAAKITGMYGHDRWRAIYERRRAAKINPEAARTEYVQLYAQGLRDVGYEHVQERQIGVPTTSLR